MLSRFTCYKAPCGKDLIITNLDGKDSPLSLSFILKFLNLLVGKCNDSPLLLSLNIDE